MAAKDWRMLVMCENCPFQRSGPGAALAKSLRPGRMASIRAGLRRGQDFFCHKLTRDTDDEDEYLPGSQDRLCAGALAYQDKIGVSSNYRRIAERLDWSRQQRTATTP